MLVGPSKLKADGSPVTQIEADQANTVIPQDYLTQAYFQRQSKTLLFAYVGGMTLGVCGIGGVAIYL